MYAPRISVSTRLSAGTAETVLTPASQHRRHPKKTAKDLLATDLNQSLGERCINEADVPYMLFGLTLQGKKRAHAQLARTFRRFQVSEELFRSFGGRTIQNASKFVP